MEEKYGTAEIGVFGVEEWECRVAGLAGKVGGVV